MHSHENTSDQFFENGRPIGVKKGEKLIEPILQKIKSGIIWLEIDLKNSYLEYEEIENLINTIKPHSYYYLKLDISKSYLEWDVTNTIAILIETGCFQYIDIDLSNSPLGFNAGSNIARAIESGKYTGMKINLANTNLGTYGTNTILSTMETKNLCHPHLTVNLSLNFNPCSQSLKKIQELKNEYCNNSFQHEVIFRPIFIFLMAMSTKTYDAIPKDVIINIGFMFLQISNITFEKNDKAIQTLSTKVQQDYRKNNRSDLTTFSIVCNNKTEDQSSPLDEESVHLCHLF